MPKIIMKKLSKREYESIDGHTLRRESGDTFYDNWVFRDEKGFLLCFGGFRNDIADKFNLELEG